MIFSLLFFLLFGFCIKLYSNWHTFLNTEIVLPGQTIHYFFKEGDTIKSVTDYFSKYGNLKHPTYLIWYAELKGDTTKLKAGEYCFVGPLSAKKMLSMIVNGEVVQHKIIFIEGWTFAQMLQQLNHANAIKHLLSGLSTNEILLKLHIKHDYLEGLFFPNTYQYIYGSSDLDILKRAHQLMQQQLQLAWQQRDENLPYQSSYQALIVASLIEKETALKQEQPIIASVIINRLKKNMNLQIDPTVIYALGPLYTGNLTADNMRVASIYNTYVNKGLPPSPICMPSENAIYAALHPAKTDYLYYVAKGDGSHSFSETLQQHDKAIQEYLKTKNEKSS